MTDRFDNFRSIAATDPEVQRRFDEGATALAQTARALLDVTIDPADLIQIDALRLAAVVGDDVDTDRALVELQRLEQVKNLVDARERSDKIKLGDQDEIDKLNKLPRHIRMGRARDLGLNDLAPKKDHTSVADPATLYQQAMKLRPADRISFMRKHGLGH